jgi:hypothetical protein
MMTAADHDDPTVSRGRIQWASMPSTASSAPASTQSVLPSKGVALAILVAALGYFVDIYDLILFSIVRITSLRSIGVPEDQILSQGVLLLNMQMGGMLIGGLTCRCSLVQLSCTRWPISPTGSSTVCPSMLCFGSSRVSALPVSWAQA